MNSSLARWVVGDLPGWGAVLMWLSLAAGWGWCVRELARVGRHGRAPATDADQEMMAVVRMADLFGQEADPVTPFTESLGDTLRRLRQTRELTIEDACRLWAQHMPSPLSTQTLTMYERGTLCPSVQQFAWLCSLFGVYAPNALAAVDDEPTISMDTDEPR